MNLGDRLAAVRKIRKISPSVLATQTQKLTGVKISQQSIFALEKRSSTRSKFAPDFAKVLEVNESWLINGEASTQGINEELLLLGRNLYRSRMSSHLDPAQFSKKLTQVASSNFFQSELKEIGFNSETKNNVNLVRLIEQGLCLALLNNTHRAFFIDLCATVLQVMPNTDRA